MNASELRTIAAKYVDHETAAAIVQRILIQSPRPTDPRMPLRPWLRCLTVRRAIDAKRAAERPAKLAKLIPTDREAFEAVHRLGLEQAAAVLGLAVDTIYARVRRAERMMKAA